jgi:hypothetical protein
MTQKENPMIVFLLMFFGGSIYAATGDATLLGVGSAWWIITMMLRSLFSRAMGYKDDLE